MIRAHDVKNYRWISPTTRARIKAYSITSGHLLKILKTIWNELVPSRYTIYDNYKLYRFDPNIHTKYYLKKSFVILFTELISRSNLDKEIVDELYVMIRMSKNVSIKV